MPTMQHPGVAMLLAAVLLASIHCTDAVHIISGSSLFTNVRSPKRLVTIHPEGTKLKSTDTPEGFTARPMIDKNGKSYVCYLPPKHAARPQEPVPEVEIPADNKAPLDLLERLSSVCLYRQEGLWTYEMCYRKQARQFRQAMGNDKGEDFSCGSFHEDVGPPDEIKVDPASPPGERILYVSHRMSGGAPCALSGARRATEVRFTCMPDVQDSVVTSVREFPTCNYVFTVATPLLCKHPLFKPPTEEIHTITCLPEATVHQGAADEDSKQAAGSAGTEAEVVQAVDQAGSQQQAGDAAHWQAHEEALRVHLDAVVRSKHAQAGQVDEEAVKQEVEAALQQQMQALQEHAQAVQANIKAAQQAAVDAAQSAAAVPEPQEGAGEVVQQEVVPEPQQVEQEHQEPAQQQQVIPEPQQPEPVYADYADWEAEAEAAVETVVEAQVQAAADSTQQVYNQQAEQEAVQQPDQPQQTGSAEQAVVVEDVLASDVAGHAYEGSVDADVAVAEAAEAAEQAQAAADESGEDIQHSTGTPSHDEL